MVDSGLIQNAILRRQIFLGRYANGTNRRAQEQLTAVMRAIQQRILFDELNDFQYQWLLDQYASVSAIAYDENIELLETESAFTSRVLAAGGVDAVETVVSSEILALFNEEKAELISGKRIQKLTPEEMVKVFDKKNADRVLQTFREMKAQGVRNDEISKEIGRISRNVSRREIEAVVRTLNNQASATARRETYQINDIDREEFVAVFDRRTTVTCGKLSGNVYKVGDGPTLPRHYNCRSVYVPFFDGDKVGDDYGDWLKKQSDATQDEVLGKERAELFRSGEVTMSEFADDKGVEYSLEELEQLYDVTIT